MKEHKIPIEEGELKVENNALFAGFQKDLDNAKQDLYDTKQLMKYVIIVLLVMVAGMIIALQIAIWQTRQSNNVHVIFDDIPQVLKNEK